MAITLILQIICSIGLIVLVTLQSSETSLSSSLSTITQSGFHTKRGPEKIIYLLTIVTGVIFIALSILNILLLR